jgi:hypothetical protein
MADLVRIWVETSHHPAFRCAGWAFVRQDREGLSGAAGGQRHVTPEHATLAGLAEALKGIDAGAAVEVRTGSRELAALPARIAGFTAGDDPPTEDLALWAQLSMALKTVRITQASPNAFAAAWAELARDKAKATGAFRAAIPRPNLAKAGI